MDKKGYQQCTPRNTDLTVTEKPFLDFTSGYVLRAVDRFPKQGSKTPWRLYQNYALDTMTLKHGRLNDGVLVFSKAAPQQLTYQSTPGVVAAWDRRDG
jgi:monooxygenase